MNNVKPKPEVNYAALSAGANILMTSLHMIGGSNLLQDHKDKYARSPCDQPKWVVINLSEDVRENFMVANLKAAAYLSCELPIYELFP